MPSAKKFLGNRCMANKTFLARAKSGNKYRIENIKEMDNQYGTDEILGIKFKEIDGYIRLNATNLIQLSNEWGDDTDDWKGKSVLLTTLDKEVDNKNVKQIVFTPSK